MEDRTKNVQSLVKETAQAYDAGMDAVKDRFGAESRKRSVLYWVLMTACVVAKETAAETIIGQAPQMIRRQVRDGFTAIQRYFASSRYDRLPQALVPWEILANAVRVAVGLGKESQKGVFAFGETTIRDLIEIRAILAEQGLAALFNLGVGPESQTLAAFIDAHGLTAETFTELGKYLREGPTTKTIDHAKTGLAAVPPVATILGTTGRSATAGTTANGR